ncbi:MAG TPA: hypothetical protein PLK12_01955 [Prolixibacteraceae bacterium]|nr:hypothetical protein [Prolixibacteraceae bacterium]
MKNTLLFIALMAMGFVALSARPDTDVLSGESSTRFGNYQLTPAPNCTVINDVAYKTWNLSYSNSPEQFQVLVSSGIDGQCCMIIRNDHFEIQYAHKDGGFGAAMVETPFRQIRKKELMKQLNYENFLSQQLLTRGPKTQEEYLGLAACFLPLLMN